MFSSKEFPIQEEYQIALNEIMQNYKIDDLTNEENLFIIFDEFYKRYGTFSIFTKSTNRLYLNAIKRVKEENEKRRKSQHYLLNINPPSSKLKELQNNILKQTSIFSLNNNDNDNNSKSEKNNDDNNNNDNYNNDILNTSNLSKFLQKVSKEKEMSLLANKNNILRKKEMEFLSNCQKKWEQKKEEENIKYNNNENDKKKEEKDFKNFKEDNLREISMNNDEFKRLLNLMKEKKRNEYEIDSYINNKNYNKCLSNLNNFYSSDETWERSTDIDGNNDNSKFRTSILINYNLNNLFKLNEEPLKKNERNFPVEYGEICLNDYQDSRVWKNFQYDFDKFKKEI